MLYLVHNSFERLSLLCSGGFFVYIQKILPVFCGISCGKSADFLHKTTPFTEDSAKGVQITSCSYVVQSSGHGRIRFPYREKRKKRLPV